MKILFAEDDQKVGKHVKDDLTAEGYADLENRRHGGGSIGLGSSEHVITDARRRVVHQNFSVLHLIVFQVCQ